MKSTLSDLDYGYFKAGPETKKAIETLSNNAAIARKALQQVARDRELDVTFFGNGMPDFTVPAGKKMPEGWDKYSAETSSVAPVRGTDFETYQKSLRDLDVQDNFNRLCKKLSEAHPPAGAGYRFEELQGETIVVCPPTLTGKTREYFQPRDCKEISLDDYQAMKTPVGGKTVIRSFALKAD